MTALTDEQQEPLNAIVAQYLASEMSVPLRGQAIRATMPGSLPKKVAKR